MLLGCHMLHSEFMAGLSTTAHAHGLQVEEVDLHEVSGCQLLKSGPVPSPLHFAWFCLCPSFISLGDSYYNAINITCNNCITDDRQ